MARTNETPVSWLRRLMGVLETIIQAVEEQDGHFNDLLLFVSNPTNLRNLGKLVMGKLELVLRPSERLVPHLVPDWVVEIVEDVEPTVTEGSTLSFPSFFRESDNESIDGPTMRERAVEMGAGRGLADVPALLGKDGKGHETIPADLRDRGYIVLTATVLRGRDGHLYVPSLLWDNDAWVMSFRRLVRGWHDCVYLVSCE